MPRPSLPAQQVLGEYHRERNADDGVHRQGKYPLRLRDGALQQVYLRLDAGFEGHRGQAGAQPHHDAQQEHVHPLADVARPPNEQRAQQAVDGVVRHGL
ncbi:hypothetical protein ACFQT0_14415 [Hymenobacter humi]|uniref:Uncharacterized protein n=1 Tax=Hymenobacter humi TaxID=1411620 RepID=A0ABW2U7V0_9BACT